MNVKIAGIRNDTWLDRYPCRNQKQLYQENAELAQIDGILDLATIKYSDVTEE